MKYNFPKSKYHSDCYRIPTPLFKKITIYLGQESYWFPASETEMKTGLVDVHEKFLRKYFMENSKIFKLFYD